MSQSYSRFQALRPEKSVTNYGVVSMRGLSKPSKVANPQDTDWINLKNQGKAISTDRGWVLAAKRPTTRIRQDKTDLIWNRTGTIQSAIAKITPALQ